ncbi:MAG: hypothetical protein Q4E54_06095 [Lachnospiraceae bacterium]|nr:hypothetical protein [Lachnospiraceae bacterium]
MTNSELNYCYRSCKDLLFQLGLMPSDKTLKEMMSCIDIPVPDVLMVRESPTDAAWLPSFQNLINGLKYKDNTHSEETHFYEAAKEVDRIHTKTAHGYLSSGPNMFARALNTYVADKLERENKKYRFTEFENCNHIWYDGYYKTHPDADEREKFSGLFDTLLSDLKETGIISELTLPKKTNLKGVRAIVEQRRERHSASESRVAQHNPIKEVRRRLQQ